MTPQGKHILRKEAFVTVAVFAILFLLTREKGAFLAILPHGIYSVAIMNLAGIWVAKKGAFSTGCKWISSAAIAAVAAAFMALLQRWDVIKNFGGALLLLVAILLMRKPVRDMVERAYGPKPAKE